MIGNNRQEIDVTDVSANWRLSAHKHFLAFSSGMLAPIPKQEFHLDIITVYKLSFIVAWIHQQHQNHMIYTTVQKS